ncbi:MAG: 3-dehydroquinate dehydratase [Paludibacteraceae bacterium]|nr:3-dehydroquinate dehydratase [Paludibacteraceae bacterium]
MNNRILIVNGPNLNLLGRRAPNLYGTRSMEQIIIDMQKAYPDVCFTYRQSNHEGDLIDWIQGAEDYKGLILNAGGYTHTSVALRDAVEICDVPVVEVHLSNITQRENFRQKSLLSDVCKQTIMGLSCYEEAVSYIMSLGC